MGEIKVEFEEVRTEMKRIFDEVGESSKKMSEEMSKMRDLINQTFHIVVDSRFKVPCNIGILVCTALCYTNYLASSCRLNLINLFSGRY